MVFLPELRFGRVFILVYCLVVTEMSVDPSMGTPNILSLYCNAAIRSTEFFIAVNSDPNVYVSTPFFLLLFHIIGYRLQSISIPVVYIIVAFTPAWLASTK